MRKAAIYARISQDREGAGLGIDRQVADCEAEAERRAWTVAEVYVDNDISAYSGKRRPAYERMLQDLAEGYRDAVIVWHLDRLTRRPIDLEDFVTVCDRGGVDVAAVHGDFNVGNGDGLFSARIMAAVAAKESDDKSRRVKRKLVEVAQQGRPHGGVRPFGYEPDRQTLRRTEAKIVKDLAERFLAGETLTSLTRWLNESDIPTPGKAAEWRTSTVRTMLRSGRISGQREHQGDIVGQAAWPAIITPAHTARIRAILDDPDRRTNRAARRYVLAGMLRCHACDATLMAHPRAGVRRYVCKPSHGGCGTTYINADRVEELLTDAVLYRLDTAELADTVAGRQRSDTTTDALADQIADDQAQLDELAGLWGNKDITASEWTAARKPIEARMSEAKRTLARLSNTGDLARYIGMGEDLRHQWAGLPLNRQRAIIATVLDQAVIGPGTNTGARFDPSRVTPVWKL